MPLVTIDNPWGGARISECEPVIETVQSAVYIPFAPDTFFDADDRWGIYHEDGSIVESAAYKRGDPPALVGQSANSAFRQADCSRWDRTACAPDGDYLYVGPLIPHYGHYILSSLSRLWPLITGDRGDAKLLFHANGSPDDWFGTSYVHDTLSALGLARDDFAVFHGPVRIKNLRVAEASFHEMSSANRIFAELCHTIGRSLRAEDKIVRGGKPLYLSKTKLKVGVGRMANEAEFLASVQARIDIDIVYPEDLSLAQQVDLFASERLILGTISSAFHTSIFADTKPKLIGISLRPFVQSNFKMIDDLNGNIATYISDADGFRCEEHVGGFLESFQALEPDRLADDLVRFLSIPRGASPLVERAGPSLGDHQGVNYRTVIDYLHQQLKPKTYLEIGTLDGGTLALAQCPSIAVDPQFRVANRAVIGSKQACHFFQMKSDDFFAAYEPASILNGPIDMAFLDGMHRCEFLLRDFINIEKHCKPNSVLVLHDCLPLEAPMAERDEGHTSIMPSRNGWWTGDVWRTVVALKKHRPDLAIAAFDAAPTGLVIITNLNPTSQSLTEYYPTIVNDMLNMSLDELTITGFFKLINVEPTSAIMSSEKLTARYWL